MGIPKMWFCFVPMKTIPNKMINGLLLSQYRKYIARDNGVELKPIILFKSNKIATSLNANRTFLTLIEEMTAERLKNLIDKGARVYQNDQSIWNKMFSITIRKKT